MKTKLTKTISVLTLAVALPLGAALTAVAADTTAPPAPTGPSAPPRIDPATGLPAGLRQPPPIDPATGLPQTVNAEYWKDPAWKDPAKKLAELRFDGLPLSEVAKMLRDQFTNAFDVLVAGTFPNPANLAEKYDVESVPVKIELRDVTASEAFNAMNLLFEAEDMPVRWELKMNGGRPIAVARVVSALEIDHVPAPSTKRTVFFVGDLLNDGNFNGMTMEKLVKTVSDVYNLSYGSSGGVLQFHNGAQLLIVTGTDEQINFVHQTLSAIKDKTQLEQKNKSKAESTAEPKPH